MGTYLICFYGFYFSFKIQKMVLIYLIIDYQKN